MCLDTGELAGCHERSFAAGRSATALEHAGPGPNPAKSRKQSHTANAPAAGVG